MNNPLLDSLNEAQRQIVLHEQGPALVIAGAGSGKTRVLAHRITWKVHVENIAPHSILAVTFTNKAAKEMQNRVMAYIKGSSNAVPWLGTFHSISVKFLRRHAEALDYLSLIHI